jgi:hypothetical protein
MKITGKLSMSMKYKKYFLFNKNILIGFVSALISGALTSHIIAPKFTFALNSLITLITEDVVFYTTFGILFYVDNKRENDMIKLQKLKSTTLHNTRFEFNTPLPLQLYQMEILC